jgi:hypothetical protein
VVLSGDAMHGRQYSPCTAKLPSAYQEYPSGHRIWTLERRASPPASMRPCQDGCTPAQSFLRLPDDAGARLDPISPGP